MNDSVYRRDSLGAYSRREELQAQYRASLGQLSTPLLAICSRRAGRMAFGVVAVVGGVAVFLVALTNGHSFEPVEPSPTVLLLATWAVAMLAYAITSALAGHRVRRLVAMAGGETDDVLADIARLQQVTPNRWLVALAHRWEFTSAALPLAGLALIVPLSLHMLPALALTAQGGDPVHDFDGWIYISAILVGHCHLVMLAYGVLYARRIQKTPLTASVADLSSDRAVATTTAVSIVPGLILLFIPTILVAITGAIHRALVYGWIRRAVSRERQVLFGDRAAEPAL